jgi:Predicted ATP-grasp enzyme
MNALRGRHAVLVTEAHTIGSLAVIRSLGRAGYRVIACSPQGNALGFHSNYCRLSRVQPDYGDTEAFGQWLDALLAEHVVELIIPSEAFLLAIRPRFEHYRHLLAFSGDDSRVYAGLSKFDLFASCRAAGLDDCLPPYILLAENDALPTQDCLAALGSPLFIKVDGTYARQRQGGAVVRCADATQALQRLPGLREQYEKVLIQGYVDGVGVGAFLASWQGKPLAEFMHRRLHEVPHTGGASSYRASWRHEKVLANARALMQQLGWEGVGMFEYRWDPVSDRFYLIEFNSRFWGSLHLALFAGVDFPRLLADAFFNEAQAPVSSYKDVGCRLTFPREMEYVLSCVRDASLPLAKRLWPLAEFFVLGANPAVYSDLSFPGDRALYGRMMVRTVQKFLS